MLFSSITYAQFPEEGNYVTGYVPGYGRFEVSVGASNSDVTIIENKMVCQYDKFGSATDCFAKSAPIVVKGELQVIDAVKEFFSGPTILFKIENTSYGVTSFNGYTRGWMRLLKYDSKGKIILSTPLYSKDP